MPSSCTPMILAEVPPILKIPAAKVPQAPLTPCTDMAPTGSSTFILSKKITEKTTIIPAMAPMIIALKGETTTARCTVTTDVFKLHRDNILSAGPSTCLSAQETQNLFFNILLINHGFLRNFFVKQSRDLRWDCDVRFLGDHLQRVNIMFKGFAG